MSESGDYTPAPEWKGHDFKSAYAHYDVHAGRGYAAAKAKNVVAKDLVPEEITTQSTHPLIIRCDVTGSMGGWPAVIFSKLPYLDHEIRKEYLSEDAEVSFGAISDTGDDYPLQIRPFAKGADMKANLEKLIVTRGGSGPDPYCEAYAVQAIYDARNVKFPRALIKPICIIIGDEMPYGMVSKEEAHDYAKVGIEEARLSASQIFKELMAVYSVYLILKPYGNESLSGDTLTGTTKTVYDCWEKILGAERIALLPGADRVVDVIFGILAKETGRIDYFRKELEARQLPDKNGKQKVETVYRSLKTVHALPKPAGSSGRGSGHSKTSGIGGGKPTKPLV